MIKLLFKPEGGTSKDWSEYLVIPPIISKSVESELAGQAGLIVFDEANIELIYNSTVASYFSDPTQQERHLFLIKLDSDLLFEGIADISSIQFSDFKKTISIKVIDKLAAINILQERPLREGPHNLLYQRNSNTTVDRILVETGAASSSSHHKWFQMRYAKALGGGNYQIYPTTLSNSPRLGEIVQSPYDSNKISLVTYVGKKAGFVGDTDPIVLDIITDDESYPKPSGNQKVVNNLFYYMSEVFGTDILVKEYRSTYIVKYQDAGNEIDVLCTPGYALTAFNGKKIIEAFIKNVWPTVGIIFKGANDLHIPLKYYQQLISENPFGKTPLDALVTLADLINCYIFFDKNGDLIIQSKDDLYSAEARSIGQTPIYRGPIEKYMWDKLVDGVEVKVNGWSRDPQTGAFLVGYSRITKQPEGYGEFEVIKPRNLVTKDLISIDGSTNTQQELNQRAYIEAVRIMEFYGKRHASFELELALDQNTINWDLTDKLLIDGKDCFIESMDINLVEKSVNISCTEIQGHEYDIRQVVISKPTNQSSSAVVGGGFSTGSQGGYQPIIQYNVPLRFLLGVLSLDFNTTNLKLTNNALNTIQDIDSESRPTFAQLTLSNPGTELTEAVRADRRVDTSFPLTGGGTLTLHRTIGLNYDSVNLNINGSNQLTTIQDIATSSSPAFAALTLSGRLNLSAGTTNANAVAWGTDIYLYRAAAKDLRVNSGFRVLYSAGGTPVFTIGDNAAANVTMAITAAASQYADILFRTSNSSRWAIRKTSDAESGSNAGSNLFVNRHDDSGSLLDTVISIRRNTGNVGIGTNIANEKLEVAGNIHLSGGDRTIFNRSNNYLALGTNNAERLRITANGSVGIGMANPSQLLDVGGNVRMTGVLQVTGTGISTVNSDVNHQGFKSFYNNFTSGWAGSGWKLGYSEENFASLELDNLWVRGTMTVYELIINQIRATNGSLFVTSSARVESANEDTAYNIRIWFEDPEGHNLCPFVEGDLLLMQRVRLDSTTVVKRVLLRVMTVSGRSIEANYVGTAPSEIPKKGELYVRVGSYTNANRRGSLYLTSDDSNAPYLDVIDGVAQWTDWGSSDKLKVRLGRLTGITDSFFGTLSGYGLYAKDNAYLRGKIYAESGGWIAGWTIDSNRLTSPNVVIGLKVNDVRLIANSSNGQVGAYVYMDTTIVDHPGYLSFGRVLSGTGAIENKMGIAFKKGSSTFFELTDTDKNIAGWSFNTTKFWKGAVSLEAGTSMKGLVVDSDKIKIGSFTFGTMSNPLTDITHILLNGYSGIEPGDSFWGILGNWWDTSNGIHDVTMEVRENLIKCVIGNLASSWSYRLTHILASATTKVMGKKAKVAFLLEFTSYPDYMEHGGEYEVAIRYYDSSFNTLYRQVIASGTVSDQIEPEQFDYRNGIFFTVPASIPSLAYIYIEWAFNGGSPSSSLLPKTMELSDLTFEGYENFKTWLNETGLYMYNSDNNYLRLHSDFSEINLPIIKIRGKQIVRFHGRLAANPTLDVEIGDMYIRTTDDKTYQCYAINNLGTPQWAALN